MASGYEKACTTVEDYPDSEIADTDFIDEVGHPKTALIKQAGQLQWILMTLCTVSASAMFRRDITSNGFESTQ